MDKSQLKEALLSLIEDGGKSSSVFDASADAKMTELCRKIDWYNDTHRQAVADVVVEKLEERIITEDMMRYFANVKEYKPGETPQFTFQKGMKAYVHERGTYAPRSHFIQRTFTLTSELISVAPEMELSQLETGRYGNVGSITAEAKKELMGRRNATLWNVLIGSIVSGDPNYVSVASTSPADVKGNFLASGLDYIDDIARVKAIVGRRSALGFVNQLTGYSEAWKEKIDSAGGKLLGSYRGVPIVALHQYTDGYDVNRINADNIMIVAEDTTIFARTERLRSLQDVDSNTRMWNLHLSEAYGAMVIWPEYNWRIAIT